MFSCLLIFLILTDCRCGSSLPIRSVVLESSKPMGVTKKLDEEQLLSLVKKAIAKNSHYRLDEHDAQAGIFKMTLVPVSERASSIMLFATLRYTADEVNEEYKSFADVKMIDGVIYGADLSAAVDRLLQDLYQRHRGIFEEQDKYLSRIQASLKGETVEKGELLNAIAIVGDTEYEKALEPLMDLLLKTKDFAIGNACLVALTSLAKEESMQSVIDYAEGKPAFIRRQAIIAARRIGSKLAMEWLLVMAYGYDDPVVRKEAMDAFLAVEKTHSVGQ